MSDSPELLATSVIITPNERLSKGSYDRLPQYVNVVEPFQATVTQADTLRARLTVPLFRREFKITGYEHIDYGSRHLQKVGGSVLHFVHDEVVSIAESLHIQGESSVWKENDEDTYYSGTWLIPEQGATVRKIHIVQLNPADQNWRVLEPHNLKEFNTDFHDDPIYKDANLKDSRIKTRRR